MASYTATAVPLAGIDTTTLPNSAGAGDLIATGDNITLVVATVGTGTTLTITTPGTVQGLAIADQAIVLATNKRYMISVPTSLYGDANQQAALSWSATAAVTFGVYAR